MMKNKKAMPVTGNGEKGDVMERGFVRIIMAVVFPVLIAVSFTACGDYNLICKNDNNDCENENGDDNGGGEVPALPDVITRDSVDSNGNEGNNSSYWFPSISADGRYVAFSSRASNLVLNDTNGAYDIFVHDRISGATTRVSVDSNGNQSDGSPDLHSYSSISADGRYVAFGSYATNLVPNDNNGYKDIFVHDRISGETNRVSVDSNGIEGNIYSKKPSISADGRYVAFDSWATNLVPNDNTVSKDIFVHDRLSGETTRASVNSSGIEGNKSSFFSSISVYGRYVAFTSGATNLVPNDNNGRDDVFVHDLQSGVTTRVSVDSNGNQGNDTSTYSSISADGRYVTFSSRASNLVLNDTNSSFDIFVHDRLSGETTRVSVDSNGIEGNDSSTYSSISVDGRYVTFSSRASNLVPNDNPRSQDIFVHDRLSGGTTRISVDSSGTEGNGWSFFPSISADGKYVTFSSYATNLVPDDNNGTYDIFTAPVP
jgi:hypothetical protein